MAQSLKLGAVAKQDGARGIRRLNKLPIIVFVALVILFFAAILFGLTSRGLYLTSDEGIGPASNDAASSYADQLKRGVPDGIIGEPAIAIGLAPLLTKPVQSEQADMPAFLAAPERTEPVAATPEPTDDWRSRLEREQSEQFYRERHRQKMARLQANDAAYDAPIGIALGELDTQISEPRDGRHDTAATRPASTNSGLYATAVEAAIGNGRLDPNGQRAKQDFFNADLKELGYLPNRQVPPLSPFELKRGSVIPATLITGIDSDLPGRITAQVSQNVYDSATGHRLLVPQGTKLFGRYDNQVSFGQSRVLVIWTDLIFPNGSSLAIGGMAGADARGNGGFADKIDNHYVKTFGAAILLAVIGAGIDMAVPQSSVHANSSDASDAARRNFAETFGRTAERTIGKNLDVQPTLRIRPGYKFNVIVDQDIVFPSSYSD